MSRSTGAPAQLWTAALAAAADRHTIDVLGLPSAVLMERAALAVSAVVERLEPRAIVVLCGPGNNGGDGLAVARQLRARGHAPRVVVLGERRGASVEAQLAQAQAQGVEVFERLSDLLATDLATELAPDTVVVDALLGTGSRGAPRGAIREALAWLAARRGDRARVVAIDVPSGVDVDRGSADPLALRATITVTFARSKPGLHVTPGRDHAGEVIVADIGLVGDPSHASVATLIDPGEVAAWLRGLPDPSHKGVRGHVGVIGGSPGTPGAAILAGTAALRAGAGLVTLAGFDPAMQAAVIASRPELMLARDEALAAADVLVVGPGLTAADALARMAELDAHDRRAWVWDASALDVFEPGRSAGPRVLTPHPGEAARLLARLADPSWTSARVEADRVSAAGELAERTGAVIVLKGRGTLVVSRERVGIATIGGPSLATAGSGDVLAGTIGAMLARDRRTDRGPWAAACVGVQVHGLAGDASPSLGTLALDVAAGLPCALERATRGDALAPWPSLHRG